MDVYVGAGLLGFALGVALYSVYSFGWSGVLFLIIVGAVLSALYAFRRNVPALILGVCLLGAAIGCVRMSFAPHELPYVLTERIGTNVVLEGKIVTDPDLRESSQRLILETEGVRVLVVAPLFPEVRYGEQVRAAGMLMRPEPFATETGRTFRYDQFLAKEGVFALIEEGHVEVTGGRSGIAAHVFGFFSDVKRYGLSSLSAALPEPTAALAGGLILGGKQGLGNELLDDFIRSGLVHIVVLSGYNVMIVAEFVLRFFQSVSKRWAVRFAAVTIVGFVLVAGAGAASVRAGIMAAIALYARATGRTYNAFRALLFAGFLMVVWNPLSLSFDPGFQLSFIATLGLIFGAPLVEERLQRIKSAFLREIVSSTIAAQIAVLPLLLYQNGLFSVVALPANILVLPVVPVAMLFSLFALIAGALVPLLAPVFGLPAYALLSYIIMVTTTAANLPLAVFALPAFPLWVVGALYAALGVWCYRASERRRSTTVQFTFSRNAST